MATSAGKGGRNHKDAPRHRGINEVFRRAAQRTSMGLGSAWAFFVALLVIVFWATTGPLAGFSDTWQLIINTGTTIVTFLMVFLIQNTQNRDSRAIHLKLDELLRGLSEARTGMVDLEDADEEELKELSEEFAQMRKKNGHALDRVEPQGTPAPDSSAPSTRTRSRPAPAAARTGAARPSSNKEPK